MLTDERIEAIREVDNRLFLMYGDEGSKAWELRQTASQAIHDLLAEREELMDIITIEKNTLKE